MCNACGLRFAKRNRQKKTQEPEVSQCDSNANTNSNVKVQSHILLQQQLEQFQQLQAKQLEQLEQLEKARSRGVDTQQQQQPTKVKEEFFNQ